jgi:hypothetical protein
MFAEIKAQASYNPDNENTDEEKQCNDVKEHIQNSMSSTVQYI